MPTTVAIPGEVAAVYDDDTGEIVSLVFTPRFACYPVHPAHHVFIEGGNLDLDVTDSDGPFWSAMRKVLSDPDSMPDDSYHHAIGWAE